MVDFKNKDELFNFKTSGDVWMFVKDPFLKYKGIFDDRLPYVPGYGFVGGKPEPDLPDAQEEKAKIDPLLIAAMAVAAFSLK